MSLNMSDLTFNMCFSIYVLIHCVCAGYSGTGGGHSGYHQYARDYTANPTASYTGGLTEEEQLETAIRNSLNDRGKRGDCEGID